MRERQPPVTELEWQLEPRDPKLPISPEDRKLIDQIREDANTADKGVKP